MSFNLNQIVLAHFIHNDFVFTMGISGAASADDVGKAVSLDTNLPGMVKLAEDGDVIYGRIYQYEERAETGTPVVSVSTRFRSYLPIKAGQAVNIGDTVVGAGSGEVKSQAAADHSSNIVLAIENGFAVVEK